MTPREYADTIMPDVIHKQGRAVEEIERVIRLAILDEREACAKVADNKSQWASAKRRLATNDYDLTARQIQQDISDVLAAEIRARTT